MKTLALLFCTFALLLAAAPAPAQPFNGPRTLPIHRTPVFHPTSGPVINGRH